MSSFNEGDTWLLKTYKLVALKKKYVYIYTKIK